MRPPKLFFIVLFGILLVSISIIGASIVLAKHPKSATAGFQTYTFENLGTHQNMGDTFISNVLIETNFGTQKYAYVFAATPGTQIAHTLIAFDLSSIPNDATITNAKIYFYVSAITNNPAFVAVYRSAEDWDENIVTWLTRPATIGPAHDVKTISDVGWNFWTITDAVQVGKLENNEVSLTFTQYPFWLSTIIENTKEAGETYAPYLEVTYTPYSPPPPPVENLLTISDNVAGCPSFNITSTGKWIATWKSPVNGDIQGGRGEIYYKTSTDQGASWSTAGCLFANASRHYDEAEIVCMPDASLWAISSDLYAASPADGAPYYSFVYRKSVDDGVTWGTEHHLDNIFAQQPDLVENGWLYAIGNHYLEIYDTRLIPVYVRDNSETVVAEAGCLKTTDSGATWSFSFINGVGFGGIQGSEPAIAWIGGNNLISIWRSVNSETNHAYKSTSSDLGDSWSTPVDIGRANDGIFNWLWDPELFWLNDDTLALIAAQTDQDVWPSCPASLTLWTSADSGTTWTFVENIMENTAYAELYHGVENTGENHAYMVYSDGGDGTAAYVIGADLIYAPPAPSPGGTYHAPITIVGNGQFTSGNGVISGSGTIGDPYIIEGWSIDASAANGIDISSTSAYFIIRNCLIENGGNTHIGISFSFVVNGTIYTNEANSNNVGISLLFSPKNSILANITNSNEIGISVVASDNNNISMNISRHNSNDGIILTFSSYNLLSLNAFESNGGNGIGLTSSSFNTIVFNGCLGNSLHGIYVDVGSASNSIMYNTGDVFYVTLGPFYLSITPASQSMVTTLIAPFYITIRNEGATAVNCILNITDNAHWSFTFLPSNFTIPENGSVVCVLLVSVPSERTIEDNAIDIFTVTVRNANDLNIIGSGTCMLRAIYASSVKPVTPVSGGISGIVELFVPFTGGDPIIAGYMVGTFFFLIPLTLVGLAVVASAKAKEHSALVTLMFYLTGLFLSTVTGLFPWWFLTFHIAVIALYFARGWIGK